MCWFRRKTCSFQGGGGGVVTRQPLVHLVSLRHKLSGRQVTGSIAHYLVTGNLDKSRSMSVFFFSLASQRSGILHSWIWLANCARSSSPDIPIRSPNTDRSEISNVATFQGFFFTLLNNVKCKHSTEWNNYANSIAFCARNVKPLRTPDLNWTVLIKIRHKSCLQSKPRSWVRSSGRTQDLEHSFSQYGPPGRQITYMH